ncbi:alpha/beta fold hydrolase [Paenibacillus sp. NPDC058174]|uniref:alpha/beta fold hydrolase n=1 Tax=Paenibacillus sp. NPDC058174 TaxID=3346366 RepID=UPI0036D99E64
MEELFIHLQDGRKLAYAEYGDPDGQPVFIFHGTPGSRIWFLQDDETAAALGLRLISTDRPGFGCSDPLPGRMILDWPRDVAGLADELGIGPFAVLGVSGGGVYAAACAFALPERVLGAAMISSAAPFPDGKPPKEMTASNKIAFRLSKYAPRLLKSFYRAQRSMIEKDPGKFMKSLRDGSRRLPEWDQQFMQTEEQLRESMVHLGEAIRISVDEAASEPALLAGPWGFEPSGIKVPLHIWHGKKDRMAPYNEMERLAGRMPQAKFRNHPEAGHFLSADEQMWRTILTELKADMSAPNEKRS